MKSDNYVPWHWFELYKAKDGHRWRLRSMNGRIMADSAEAYSTASGAKRAAKTIKKCIQLASITVRK
jgi:uncharacterized protein YegP (UPF0339 family)